MLLPKSIVQPISIATSPLGSHIDLQYLINESYQAYPNDKLVNIRGTPYSSIDTRIYVIYYQLEC